MRVVVDHNLCQSYAECVRHAPEIFSLDDDDQQRVTTVDLDEQFADQVKLAIDGCPMQAIRRAA
jgi:ferredoxin